ncbi:MAG: DNA polymerase III subunit epsilon [Holosporales bacterium]|jgi:DNA polymerase-3 subunit epsilon|nr:DNA polymerase III subunit epsilon [Holosporales bacterium]
MREVVLDTETTGLSFMDGDKVAEIGCVEIIDKKITGKTFHIYINPQREMSEEAFKISGLTYDFLGKFKPFKEIYMEFLNFILDSRLIIHNAPFDIGFLNHELSLIGAAQIQSHRVLDTLQMAKEKFPGSPSTLDALCRRFSIDLTPRYKHGALIDAELLANVYLHMSVEFLQKDIFNTGQDTTEETNFFERSVVKNLEPRHFFPSNEEHKLHSDLLKKIKNPIWEKFYDK